MSTPDTPANPARPVSTSERTTALPPRDSSGTGPRGAEWSGGRYPPAPAPGDGVSAPLHGPAPRPAAVAAAPGTPGPRARRARLVVARVDPWSVMKLSFVLAVAAGIVWVVAVFVLWSVLDAMGVFSSVGQLIEDITRGESAGEGFQLLDYVALNKVMGVTTILALVNVVMITALATLGAFLYNVTSGLVGGLTVTLSEDS